MAQYIKRTVKDSNQRLIYAFKERGLGRLNGSMYTHVHVMHVAPEVNFWLRQRESIHNASTVIFVIFPGMHNKIIAINVL